jgi:hypothetical protein
MKTSHLVILVASISVLVALFFILYLGGASFVPSIAGQKTSDIPVSGEGLLNNQLPYFDLPNLVGDRVRSADFIHQPLVIMFWSTWNTQAADEVHILDQYLTNQPPQSQVVKIVAIDSQEEKSTVSSFMFRGGYQVQTLLDTQGIAGERYALKSVPTFYFVDSAGVIREIYSGMLNELTLMNKIENILQ